MRILLFGANGQLGTALRQSLQPLGEVVATTRDGILLDGSRCLAADFATPEVLPGLVRQAAPDIVVNAAAYTAVDHAEDDTEAAFRVNAEAPARIAEACAACNATLVHYSTDYVFDGRSTRPYREDDAVDPLGVYGESKRSGELAVLGAGTRHIVLRTAWVYSWHGRNFMRTMLRLAAARDELRVVADQLGSPTPATLIADVTARILMQAPERAGLWHLTTTGQTSWHGFASAIIRKAFESGLLSHEPALVPIETAEYPTRAHRPAYSVLDCSRLASDFNLTLPDWSNALERVLASPH